MNENIENISEIPVFEKWPSQSDLSKSMNHVYKWITIVDYLGRVLEKCPFDLKSIDSEFTPRNVTYMKLLLLGSYTRVFLDIGSKYFSNLYYLDVLSASGFSRLRPLGNVQHPVPGSCFLVPLAHQDFSKKNSQPKHTFSKVWTFDKNSEALDAIRSRRDYLVNNRQIQLPEYNYIPGDVNQTIIPVLNELKNETDKFGHMHALCLVFIDNLGFNVEMKTIELIQQKIRGDLVIHLPTSSLWRDIRSHRQSTFSFKDTLDKFFGGDEWENIENPDEIPIVYQKAILKVTKKSLQDFSPVKIQGKSGYFHLCIYARKTSGTTLPGRSWINRIRKFASVINNELDYRTIDRILQRTLQNQTSLFEFNK